MRCSWRLPLTLETVLAVARVAVVATVVATVVARAVWGVLSLRH